MSPLQDLVDRSRRLGADQSLVVFGGGNTSAKGLLPGPDGGTPVMWIKASGADMRVAQECDYPALRLADLERMRAISDLSDEEMTELIAQALVEEGAPRPSIETLFHAFVPHRHVDHVHADAICALTNHPEGRKLTQEALGETWAYVDWMRTGFPLSKIVAELTEYEGVVLAHHGLITWADTSDDCYARTLAAVGRADEYVCAHTVAAGPAPRHDDMPDAELRSLLLHLRGRLSKGGPRVLHVDRRQRVIADRPDAAEIVRAGVSSADHMLRMKPWSMLVEDTDAPGVARAVDSYAEAYGEYAARNHDLMPAGFGGHDRLPRVALVPGLGAVTSGATPQEARMVADISLHTHHVAARTLDAFGAVEPLPESEIFRFDYWPMELFKLSLKPAPLEFAGRVCIVTGAASGIGRGIAQHLVERGASLVVADLDATGLRAFADAAVEAGHAEPVAVAGDQSDADVVARTVRAAVDSFGGLDGVVINAGIGVTGELDELTLDQWQAALRINLTSAFLLTQEAIRVFKEQDNGGALVYVASKNAFSPGAGFGAYSVSKAGMVQLMRIAALEGGRHGIRSNAVNPDAVFDNSRLWDDGLREERAAAHGIAPDQLEDFYAARNLLHRHVTTADVAESVAFLLSERSSRTTGCVIPVDGGVAAGFPR